MEFDFKKHWYLLLIVAVAFAFIVFKGQLGFMGAALSLEDQSLCASSGGIVKYVATQDTITLAEGDNNITLKANNESYKVPAIFSSIEGYYSLATTIVPSDTADSVKDYIPGASTNDLAEISALSGWNVSIRTISAKNLIYTYNLPSCECAAGKVFVPGTGCTASNNQSICLSTAGIWNATGNRCSCSALTKWVDSVGCQATVAKKAFCMDDLCTNEQTFNLLATENLASNCFANQTKCKDSLECTINSDCSKEIDAPNDCSVFFSPYKITQAGSCSAGVCKFPIAISNVCTSSELWWQDNIRWILAISLLAIIIIYLIWERGPKRGFFK
jgi:hypothetical protein